MLTKSKRKAKEEKLETEEKIKWYTHTVLFIIVWLCIRCLRFI